MEKTFMHWTFVDHDAGALIQHAAATLAAAGERELALFVTVGNSARPLYERLGFVAVDDPDRR